MKPILFEIFGYKVSSYFVFWVLGLVVALLALLKVTPKDAPEEGGGLNRGQVWDLFIVMVLASTIGSKVGHVLFEAPGHLDEDGNRINSLWELLKADPWHFARLGEGGYVWYGGLILCLVVAAIYFRRRPHLNAWLYSDAFAPAIMLGAVVGRLGCFLAGCCYGVETDLPWGVHFPRLPAPVHPTQLYDSSIALIVGLYLLYKFPRRRFDGQVITLLLILYSVLRAFTEHFRGDPERGSLGPFSTSQLLSVPLFVAGVLLYRRQAKRAQASSADLPAAPPLRTEPEPEVDREP